MSFDLLPLSTHQNLGNGEVLAVDLRRLHQALGVSTQYKDWAQRRISDSMALNGRDFLTLKSEHNLKGGRPQIDHLVTLDTAKHIAMLERNEKGRQIREYFIRVEKEFRAQSTPRAVAAWLAGKLLEIMPAEKLLPLLTVHHSYGSIARNGKPRTGWRRPAYVAAPHRLKDAQAFQEGMVQLNLTVQLELPKLAEAVAAMDGRRL